MRVFSFLEGGLLFIHGMLLLAALTFIPRPLLKGGQRGRGCVFAYHMAMGKKRIAFRSE